MSYILSQVSEGLFHLFPPNAIYQEDNPIMVIQGRKHKLKTKDVRELDGTKFRVIKSTLDIKELANKLSNITFVDRIAIEIPLKEEHIINPANCEIRVYKTQEFKNGNRYFIFAVDTQLGFAYQFKFNSVPVDGRGCLLTEADMQEEVENWNHDGEFRSLRYLKYLARKRVCTLCRSYTDHTDIDASSTPYGSESC